MSFLVTAFITTSPQLKWRNRSHIAIVVLNVFHRRQHVLGLERLTGAFSNFPHNYGRSLDLVGPMQTVELVSKSYHESGS